MDYGYEVKRLIEKNGNQLTPREREILEMRFGTKDGITHTLEQVGKEHGLTRERIRQIEAKALMIIRREDPRNWIIWSIEHTGWWGKNGNGYLAMRADAGRYTFDEACRIVKGANIGERDEPNEAMIKLTDEEYAKAIVE